MAEWLGTGLQNRLQQFDSAWYLYSVPPSKAGRFFISVRCISSAPAGADALNVPHKGVCDKIGSP